MDRNKLIDLTQGLINLVDKFGYVRLNDNIFLTEVLKVIKVKICVLCSKEFTEYGNNPQPLAQGICCDNCNTTKVIPAKINPFIYKEK